MLWEGKNEETRERDHSRVWPRYGSGVFGHCAQKISSVHLHPLCTLSALEMSSEDALGLPQNTALEHTGNPRLECRGHPSGCLCNHSYWIDVDGVGASICIAEHCTTVVQA